MLMEKPASAKNRCFETSYPPRTGGGEFSTEADERPWDSSRGGTGRYVHATPLFNREKLMGHLDGDEVDSME